MKREYMKPLTEAVFVRCNEKLMWGEMGVASQTDDHTDSKKGFFDDDDDFMNSSDLWDDNDSFGE